MHEKRAFLCVASMLLASARRHDSFLGLTSIGYPENMFRQLLALLLLALVPSVAIAETYPVQAIGDGFRNKASGTCVGTLQNDSYVFLSNKHVIENTSALYIHDGNDWHRAINVERSDKSDLISFEVKKGNWKTTRLVEDVPNRVPVEVCGYSDRRNFCFDAVFYEDVVVAKNKQHVIQGDSGGAIVVEGEKKNYVAGIIYAYDDSNNTRFVSTADCCQLLRRVYGRNSQYCQTYTQICPGGSCPQQLPQRNIPPGQYREYERYTPPGLFRPPNIERYRERGPDPVPRPERRPKPQPTPDVDKDQVTVIIRNILKNDTVVQNIVRSEVEQAVQAEVRRYFTENADEFKGEDGKDGVDGEDGLDGLHGNDADCKCDGDSGCKCEDGNSGQLSIDIDKLAATIVKNFGTQLKGEDGEHGEDGVDGATGGVGPVGPPGTVNVIIQRKNESTPDDSYNDLVSGSTVVVELERYEVVRTSK